MASASELHGRRSGAHHCDGRQGARDVRVRGGTVQLRTERERSRILAGSRAR